MALTNSEHLVHEKVVLGHEAYGEDLNIPIVMPGDELVVSFQDCRISPRTEALRPFKIVFYIFDDNLALAHWSIIRMDQHRRHISLRIELDVPRLQRYQCPSMVSIELFKLDSFLYGSQANELSAEGSVAC